MLPTRKKRDGVRLDLHRHLQEGGRNGRGVLGRALVLADEQILQLSPQVRRAAILFRRVERVHGRPVVLQEFIHDHGGSVG